MHEHLQPWFRAWLGDMEESDLIYKDGAKHQIMYVRDHLAPLIWRDKLYEEVPRTEDDEDLATAFVIGTHTSKSVPLPVYALERPDRGLRIILRDNFHDWKMSVISEVPVEIDLSGLCYTASPREPEYTGNCLASVYFEGFPRELVFGYYDESDKRKWSAAFFSREAVWTAIFLICRARGIIEPMRQHTREEHQAELERSRALREARKKERS